MSKKTKHILLAEDDEILYTILLKKLKAEKIKVTLAKDGIKELQLIKKNIPDLIIQDLLIPKINGYEILKKIQNNPKLKNIKTIVCSNLSDNTAIKKSKKLGAVDFLIKSEYSLDEIIKKITDHLK